MLWKSAGNWQQSRTVNFSEFGWHSPVYSMQETTQKKIPPKHYHYTETGGQNTKSSLREKRNHTHAMGQCHHEGPSLTKTPNLTRPEGKGDKTGRLMASEHQINRLHELLAVKMIWQQIVASHKLLVTTFTFIVNYLNSTNSVFIFHTNLIRFTKYISLFKYQKLKLNLLNRTSLL